MSWDWLMEQLQREGAVIKQAPLSFIILFLLCLGLAFFILRWIYKDALSRKDDIISDLGKKIGLQPTPQGALTKLECPDKWLHELAQQHREEIGRYVLVVECRAELNNRSATPYVKFTVEYYNSSVYTISIDPKFSGSISYGNRRLTEPIEISTHYPLDNIGHGYSSRFDFYQWLRAEELDFILNDTNARANANEFDLSQLIFPIVGSRSEFGVTPQPLRFGNRNKVRLPR